MVHAVVIAAWTVIKSLTDPCDVVWCDGGWCGVMEVGVM